MEDHYRHQYYEALDIAIFCITDRFDQPGYIMYRNLASLLVSAANGQVCDQYFDNVTTFYKDDFDRPLLSAQLQNFGASFAEKTEKTETISLGECMTFLRSLSLAHKSFFSEVCRLANLILVMPATNAVSDLRFLAMRRLKTYLRSTMSQSRLNHVMLLSINREKVDKLGIDVIADQFVQGSEHRLRHFGKFASNTFRLLENCNVIIYCTCNSL